MHDSLWPKSYPKPKNIFLLNVLNDCVTFEIKMLIIIKEWTRDDNKGHRRTKWLPISATKNTPSTSQFIWSICPLAKTFSREPFSMFFGKKSLHQESVLRCMGHSKLHKYVKPILPAGEESAIFTSTIRQIFYCCLRTCFLPFHCGRNFLNLSKKFEIILKSKSVKI